MSEMFSPLDPSDAVDPRFKPPGDGDESRPPEVEMALHSDVLDDDPPPEEEIQKAPIWLVTFGDATALMLAFFVMLYSMSHLQSEEWDDVVSVLSSSQRPVTDGEPRPTGERAVVKVTLVPAFETGYLQRILEEKLRADPLLNDIRLTGLHDELVLSLPGRFLFVADSAELTETGARVLGRLSVMFRQFGNRMDVRGHTPPDETGAGWGLSLGRAVAVVQTLEASGIDGDFTAFGLADSAYRAIDANIPEARRLELADRVDIVIRPEARGQ
jgi:chemotaxis protein MotB